MLTASVMVIGGALLIFSFGLSDGTHEQWIDSGIRTSTGHITIEQPDFRRSRKLEDRLMTDVRGKAEQALAAPGIAAQVVAVSSRLSVSALASSAQGARPVQVQAVDVRLEVRPLVEHLLLRTPVVCGFPVIDELLEVFPVGAVGPRFSR